VLNVGDLYTIAGAFFFALSIVMLAKPPEGGHFAAGAFLLGVTLFLGSAVYFFTVEGGVVPNIDWRLAILPILYLSIGSNFIAQTLQIVAQRHLSASTASLIMVLEGVFGSIFSILFGYEPFTLSLLLGGALIIFSLILSELQILPKNKKRIK
ncbi:MAG: DMT family transporter, partial [Oscillospiraceae bacterium]